MNWTTFQTHNDSQQDAFETLCTQLFERHLRRTYGVQLIKFRVVNGAGGDGGIEAYGELATGSLIGIQAKWFPNKIENSQIGQIKKSIETALSLRSNITEYIICLPRAHGSLKFGKGKKGEPKKPITKTEEKAIDDLTATMEVAFPSTKLTWWYEQELELQIQESDNEGVHRFWFEKELMSFKHLVDQFDIQKAGWLQERYIPALHGRGIIQQEIEQVLFHSAFRGRLLQRLRNELKQFENAAELAEGFVSTLNIDHPAYEQLTVLPAVIRQNLIAIRELEAGILEGAYILKKPTLEPLSIDRALLTAIKFTPRTNLQLGFHERLLESLQRIEELNLEDTVDHVISEAGQIGRLFLGQPGTGKTHALTNAVDLHLKEETPALIIRAKGTPAGNWTHILHHALELPTWTRNEILSALESLAIRSDNQEKKDLKKGEELKKEPAKVVICVDGLDEDTANWEEWHHRILESLQLMAQYPRVRFVYTARPYFFNPSTLPVNNSFKVTTLPLEGDVPVSSVIDEYFREFSITVEPKSLVRGIDSLFALRLFCRLYQGRTLNSEDEILVAEKDLLRAKVNELELEFKQHIKTTAVRSPIQEALEIVSDLFFEQAEITHDDLFAALEKGPGKYLDAEGLDMLIETLFRHGFLIRSEVAVKTSLLARPKISYSLTYQSIMELVMAEKTATQISEQQIQHLPAALLTVSAPSSPAGSGALVHERIVQQVVNQLYYAGHPLVGEGGFLSAGLSDEIVENLRIRVLIEAPRAISEDLKRQIRELYMADFKSRFFVFSNLIFPASFDSASAFGADFLHEILMAQPTAFAREELWLGWDRYDTDRLERERQDVFEVYSLLQVLDSDKTSLSIPALALHNETPLIYGWALATLDQTFRSRTRVALTLWALQQPAEFVLLIEKLFPCNDPQIQEDLASISLALATRLKKPEVIQQLAQWALQNIFAVREKNRNVVVRESFRTVVEKALTNRSITKEEAQFARPSLQPQFTLIPLDRAALAAGREEVYPIVHDLAWYVIKRSVDDFMEPGTVDAFVEDEDAGDEEEANLYTKLLQAYLGSLNRPQISSYQWATAAAIAYMKTLGFSRTEGNDYTDATHGSKSQIFTLEEKYTWLAVHYIKGYLADHLPLIDTGEPVHAYVEIEDIPNPAESLPATTLHIRPLKNNWVIREILASEISSHENVAANIEATVMAEPVVDFRKWIQFEERNFIEDGQATEWLALYNYTSVHDSQEWLSGRIVLNALLVAKGDVPELRDLLLRQPVRTHFIKHFDQLNATPHTDTYSNPTDIVAMPWIGEREWQLPFYSAAGVKKWLQYTTVRVVKNSVDGEDQVTLPSKRVRKFLGISELDGQLLLNEHGELKGFIHRERLSNFDRQEMVLVNALELKNQLKKENLEIIWLAEIYKTKNPHKKNVSNGLHPMRTRKYIVYREGDLLKWQKFWDAHFSNKLDEEELPE